MKDKISIRRMDQEDCARVADLLKVCFTRPWTAESLDCQGGGYIHIVAQTEGRIVGYAGLRAVLDEADITNVAVDPEFRKQNIATELMRALLAEAGRQGIRTIYLEVRSSNLAARTLYNHAGFAEVGTRKDYYQDPREDACLMKHEL